MASIIHLFFINHYLSAFTNIKLTKLQLNNQITKRDITNMIKSPTTRSNKPTVAWLCKEKNDIAVLGLKRCWLAVNDSMAEQGHHRGDRALQSSCGRVTTFPLQSLQRVIKRRMTMQQRRSAIRTHDCENSRRRPSLHDAALWAFCLLASTKAASYNAECRRTFSSMVSFCVVRVIKMQNILLLMEITLAVQFAPTVACILKTASK